MTAMQEAKVAQSSINFGLSVVLLGRIPTGSTFSAPNCQETSELTTFYHFHPHLSRKSFIVKRKLEGRRPTPALSEESTISCGPLFGRPQAVAFTLLVLSLNFRSQFS